MKKKDRGKKGFSKNPWLSTELGARKKQKDFNGENQSMLERIEMEKQSKQTIIIKPRKVGFGLIIPERWKTFTIECNPPILKEDFYMRMQKAFPDCVWKGEQ